MGPIRYWVPFEYDGMDFKFGEKSEVKVSYIPVSAVKEVSDLDEAVQEHKTSLDQGTGTITYSTGTVAATASELSEEEADKEIARLTSL